MPQTTFVRFWGLRNRRTLVRTFCFFVVGGDGGSSVCQLPCDLPNNSCFSREFAAEPDDVAGEAKRAFDNVARLGGSHHDSQKQPPSHICQVRAVFLVLTFDF
jgi:hypothetical protein